MEPLRTFRAGLHACFARRADALVELGDALLGDALLGDALLGDALLGDALLGAPAPVWSPPH